MINETTLITGSTEGIGKKIGLDLLDKGHFVIFTGRNVEHSIAFEEELIQKGYKNFTLYRSLDLSKQNSIYELVLALDMKKTKINNLILNVGTTCRKSLEEISIEEWNDVFNTNLTYPFFLIQALLPFLKKRIIFIGSVTGHIPNSVSIPYGVSKGSLEILTQYLARDLAKRKITVNTIAPGYIWTPWHQGKPTAQLKRIKRQNLLKRFGTTEEISKTVQFIIDNGYVNGQTICVDGGFHLE